MNNSLRENVRRYLRNHNVATLATSCNGKVQAAALFYVNDGYTLYFLSSPTSRHCLNLSQDPRVAVTIQGEYSNWFEIKGVQIEGDASKLSAAEEEQARRLYERKFPVVGLLTKAPSAIVKALSKVCWYKIVPYSLCFIDNSIGFGHRDEIDLSAHTKE
jgi:uncharacterized protein YhbP (UPF0306 family)